MADEREIRLRTIRGVLDLMNDAGNFPDARAPDTIYPHTNGYGCWFIAPLPDGTLLSTKSLEPEEILARIEARENSGPKSVTPPDQAEPGVGN